MTKFVNVFTYKIATKHMVFFFILSVFIQSSTSNNVANNNSKQDLKPMIVGISKDLDDLKNDELLVSVINSFNGTFKLSPKSKNPEEDVKIIADKLKSNINIIFNALEKTKSDLKLYGGSVLRRSGHSTIKPCKESLEGKINQKADETFNKNSSEYVLNHVLDKLSYDLWTLENYVKQLYLLTSVDVNILENNVAVDKCSGIDNSILWQNYMSHYKYHPRRIILLLDHGGSLDKHRLYLTKLMAKKMVSVLNPTDKFAVIGIASNWSSLTVNEECGNENLPTILAATDNNKELTYNVIDALSSKNDMTNHRFGMKIAMKMARLFYSEDDPIMLLYISGGQMYSLQEAAEVMSIITTSNLTCPLIINTCAISSNNDPTPQDMFLLSDYTNEYYIKHNRSNNQLIIRGLLLVVENVESIGVAVARFYNAFIEKSDNSEKKISLPTWDFISQDTTISFTTGFYVLNQFLVVGVDVIYSKFVREIINYGNNQPYAFALLMDTDGRILVHPSISIDALDRQMKFADVSKYFKEVNMRQLKQDIIHDEAGIYSSENTTINYIWHHINEHYVILMVVNKTADIPMIPSNVNWYPRLVNNHLVSYLFDLAVGTTLCKHHGQVATLDTASLYLSQNCFQNLMNKQDDNITKLFPYLQHENLLIKNENLKEGVHDEMGALIQVSDVLRKKHLSSSRSGYVLRRYAATKSGILQVFPGVALSHAYEPTRRPWFLRAQQLDGKLVVSPPYLDSGGGGYIVSVSHATVYLVLGIDVTYGYFLKILLEQMPECLVTNITCFLLDDHGYLISHPNLLDQTDGTSEPVEQFHVVHKESSVGNDLLNHGYLIKKLACNNYMSGTIQRYYQLNMSYNDVLTSLVLGEPCVSYSLTPLLNTNLFIGVVKATCSVAPTFCPCSVIDRLCLNCQRMEKRECECPCECPVRRSSCTSYTSHDDYNLCSWLPETYSPDPVFVGELPTQLKECFPIDCDSRSTYFSCLGVTGCEWCKMDNYGFPLNSPFCSTIEICFNGVLGSPSPYTDNTKDSATSLSSVKNTGLILGLLLALGIVISLLFICWRSYNNNPRLQRINLSIRHEENLHMSDFHVNDDFPELGNHSDKLLLDDKKITPISPYCVTSNYARPVTAADSDHGYSTMTPHDESEQLSLAPIEIDSLEDDMGSDDKTPPLRHKTPLTTRIPHKNYLIVPVTVHRNVDAT